MVLTMLRSTAPILVRSFYSRIFFVDILSDIAKSKNEISIIEEFEWNGSEWLANMIFHKKTKETLDQPYDDSGERWYRIQSTRKNTFRGSLFFKKVLNSDTKQFTEGIVRLEMI